MIDAVIVGAGIIGLACAARLARPGRDLLVLERHDHVLAETSSRNSEVLHAGFYYPPGSRKARTCVRGRQLTVRRCEERGIPWLPCGKILVGHGSQDEGALQLLRDRGIANGVSGLRIIDGAELRRIEPHAGGTLALWSPDSGVVDSHRLGLSLQAEAESKGATVVLGAALVGADRVGEGYRLAVVQGGQRFTVEAARVVNAAGLSQPQVSALVGLTRWPQTFVRGAWYTVRGAPPVRTLVYPPGSADRPGLGIHGCLDLARALRLGPDARAARDEHDLDVAGDEDAFFVAGQRLFPWLRREELFPGMAGIRPKLAGDGFHDFVLEEGTVDGLPGWLTLAGIESPGLTAALALAEEVEAALPAW